MMRMTGPLKVSALIIIEYGPVHTDVSEQRREPTLSQEDMDTVMEPSEDAADDGSRAEVQTHADASRPGSEASCDVEDLLGRRPFGLLVL